MDDLLTSRIHLIHKKRFYLISFLEEETFMKYLQVRSSLWGKDLSIKSSSQSIA